MSWHKILLSQPQIISPLYLLTSSTVTNVLLSHLGTYFYWFLLFPPYSKHSNQSDPLIIWIRWSVQLSHSVLPDSLWPHGLQQARLPCPSPIPGVYSNSCLLSHWCHPTILSSVVPFSSCLQSFPASGSFPMSQFFTSCGQSIGVSASTSVLPMNIQDWFPLGCTGWISLQSTGLSRVFSNTTV